MCILDISIFRNCLPIMPSHQYLHKFPVDYLLQNLPWLFVILIFSFVLKPVSLLVIVSSSQIINKRHFFANFMGIHPAILKTKNIQCRQASLYF